MASTEMRHAGRNRYAPDRKERVVQMILAQKYLARYETPFAAYMALQRALLLHYLSCGGTEERWCADMAPVFHERYKELLFN